MLEPSVLAPLVTSTLVQAWLSWLAKPMNAMTEKRIAVESLLILYFYYN
jgi:hypothetical protein